MEVTGRAVAGRKWKRKEESLSRQEAGILTQVSLDLLKWLASDPASLLQLQVIMDDVISTWKEIGRCVPPRDVLEDVSIPRSMANDGGVVYTLDCDDSMCMYALLHTHVCMYTCTHSTLTRD